MASPTFLLIAIIVPMVAATDEINWLLTNSEKDLEFQALKVVEIEKVKDQILQALDKTETPVNEESPPSLSEDFLRLLLLAENVPTQEPPKDLGYQISYPINNYECTNYDVFCRRYKFILPRVAMLSKFEFWVYKLKSLPSRTQIALIRCESLGGRHEMTVPRILLNGGDEMWITINIPFLNQLNDWKDQAICWVEVTGISIDVEQKKPFFKMTTLNSRKRRSEDGPAINETCKPLKFKMSFDEIGFGDFVLYPNTIDVNLCNGYCPKTTQFQQTIVSNVSQINQNLGEQLERCWTSCCRPREYQPLPLIVRIKNPDTKVLLFQHMTIMVVKSCFCG